jgi:hypothetical protein
VYEFRNTLYVRKFKVRIYVCICLQACSTYDVLLAQDPIAMANVSTNTITYMDVLMDESPQVRTLTR